MVILLFFDSPPNPTNVLADLKLYSKGFEHGEQEIRRFLSIQKYPPEEENLETASLENFVPEENSIFFTLKVPKHEIFDGVFLHKSSLTMP
jgi:hypothetical protein